MVFALCCAQEPLDSEQKVDPEGAGKVSASDSRPQLSIHVPGEVMKSISGEKNKERSAEKPEGILSKIDRWLTPVPDPAPEAMAVPSPPAQNKHILVEVPPGVPAGSTMQVEVPGEGRTLTVTVPAAFKSFYVSYIPQQSVGSRLGSTKTTNPIQVNGQPSQRETVSGLKLLKVHIPSGVKAGTILHVSAPNEPGRILAAKVPEGDMKYFHVSYEPRALASPHMSPHHGMLPTASAYSHGGKLAPQPEHSRIVVPPQPRYIPPVSATPARVQTRRSNFSDEVRDDVEDRFGPMGVDF